MNFLLDGDFPHSHSPWDKMMGDWPIWKEARIAWKVWEIRIKFAGLHREGKRENV